MRHMVLECQSIKKMNILFFNFRFKLRINYNILPNMEDEPKDAIVSCLLNRIGLLKWYIMENLRKQLLSY